MKRRQWRCVTLPPQRATYTTTQSGSTEASGKTKDAAYLIDLLASLNITAETLDLVTVRAWSDETNPRA